MIAHSKRLLIGLSMGLALGIGQNTLASADSASHPAAPKGDYPDYPTIKYGTGEKAASIKRGEYLVKASDCIACHTNPGGKPFSGGLPIKTPFGTIYSQNITPDPKTGIGKWTDKEFLRAMKEGVSPDGSYYFPVFPYPYFNKMTDQDILDIKAYLSVIPAVEKENRPVEMGIPFRWRFMQLGWRMMFYSFYTGELKDDPNQSAQWNRGRYLVEGPGHCSMCHTPMNKLGGPKRKYYLTGGFVDGFYAPNISSATLKKHSIEDITKVFLEDRNLNGGKISAPPMLEVNHASLSLLEKKDLEAIAVYLQSVVSKTPPKPKQSNKVDLGRGKEIFNQYYMGCHITGAGGAFKYGDKAAWQPLIDKGVDELYKNAITGIGNMPPKGNCISCSDADIQSAVNYIVAGVAGEGQSVQSTRPTVKLPTPTVKLGKQVYDRVCSLCHNDGHLGAPKIGDKPAWKQRIKQNMDVLFKHAIQGYKQHPPRGACVDCSDTEIYAAVKYMIEQSKSSGDYNLW